METELTKAVLGAGGMTGLIFLGVWQLLKRAIDGFTHAMDTINQLHKERADGLEKKLDACEQKHEAVNAQIGHLREANGILTGKVQTLELITSNRQERRQEQNDT